MRRRTLPDPFYRGMGQGWFLLQETAAPLHQYGPSPTIDARLSAMAFSPVPSASTTYPPRGMEDTWQANRNQEDD